MPRVLAHDWSCLSNLTSIESNTVDGKNPATVEVGSLSHYLQGFSTVPGGCLGFLPSTL